MYRHLRPWAFSAPPTVSEPSQPNKPLKPDGRNYFVSGKVAQLMRPSESSENMVVSLEVPWCFGARCVYTDHFNASLADFLWLKKDLAATWAKIIHAALAPDAADITLMVNEQGRVCGAYNLSELDGSALYVLHNGGIQTLNRLRIMFPAEKQKTRDSADDSSTFPSAPIASEILFSSAAISQITEPSSSLSKKPKFTGFDPNAFH